DAEGRKEGAPGPARSRRQAQESGAATDTVRAARLAVPTASVTADADDAPVSNRGGRGRRGRGRGRRNEEAGSQATDTQNGLTNAPEASADSASHTQDTAAAAAVVASSAGEASVAANTRVDTPRALADQVDEDVVAEDTSIQGGQLPETD